MSRRDSQAATGDDLTITIVAMVVIWFAMVGFGCWFSGDCSLAWWRFFLN